MDAADRELESLLVATLHPLSDFLYAVILNKPSSSVFFYNLSALAFYLNLDTFDEL